MIELVKLALSSGFAVFAKSFDKLCKPRKASEDTGEHERARPSEHGFWMLPHASDNVYKREGHEDAATEGEGGRKWGAKEMVQSIVAECLAHLPAELQGIGRLGETGRDGDEGPARI